SIVSWTPASGRRSPLSRQATSARCRATSRSSGPRVWSTVATIASRSRTIWRSRPSTSACGRYRRRGGRGTFVCKRAATASWPWPARSSEEDVMAVIDLTRYIVASSGTWTHPDDDPLFQFKRADTIAPERLLLRWAGDFVALTGPLFIRVTVQAENMTLP